MTVSHEAVFPQTIKVGVCTCTAAKTTYNNLTNAVLLYTAGAEGSEISHLSAMPRATVTATQAQIFLSLDGGATGFFLSSEVIAANPMSQTTKCAATPIPNSDGTAISESSPLRLPANAKLYAGIGVALAAGVDFMAQGRDY